MSNKTLGPTGLAYLWSKIKSIFATKAEIDTQLGEIVGDLEGVAYIDDDDGTSGSIDFGSLNLEDISNVTITNPSNNQGLIYNSSTEQWINGTISGGGGDTNVIETVKVNGIALTPDSNKAVDISTVTSFNGNTGAVTYTAPVTSVNGNTGAVTLNIPAEVTESTVSNWGFTKNTGTYSKPTGGIPKTDLASDVQISLGLADTALQSYTETDPTVPSWAKQSSKPTYTASEVGALPDTTVIPTESTVSGWGFTKNTGTLTGVTFNNTTATVSNGVASITAIIPTVPTNVSDFTNDANYVTSDNTVAIYSGSSAPSSSLGKNGDIYIQTS